MTFFWDNMGKEIRKDLFYGRLYWLTSDNTVPPFAEAGKDSVEDAMQQCFSNKLGHRLDFNKGTYSFLHHNCNKFSIEVMRHLDLPRFAAKKGRHSSIDLYATTEESWLRRWVSGVLKSVIPKDGQDVPLSDECRETFFKKRRNCRRVGGVHKRGDCPTADGSKVGCYDDQGQLASPVNYTSPVNGVCGLPRGSGSCALLAPEGWRCQPGSDCTGDGVCA